MMPHDSLLSNSEAAPGQAIVPAGPPAPIVGSSLQSLPGAPAYPPAAPPRPNALALLRSLQRRWALALVVGLLFGGSAAAVVWFVVPPAQYATRALLHVSSFRPAILFKTAEKEADFAIYQKTQLQLIRSHLVLDAVLESNVKDVPAVKALLAREEDPVAWLEKRLETSYNGQILSISMRGDERDALAPLVNAVKDAYLSEVVRQEKKERQERYDKLVKIFDGYQNRLKKDRHELESLAEEIGGNDRDTVRLVTGMAIERRGDVERELMRVQMDLLRAKMQLTVRRRAAAGGQSAAAAGNREHLLDDFIDAHDDSARELQERIAELKDRVGRARQIARGESDPSVGGPREQLARATRSLADRHKGLRNWAADEIRRQREGEGDSALAQLKQEVAVLEGLERQLSRLLESSSVETKQINKSTLSLDKTQAEIAHADAAAKRVGDELEWLGVELLAPDRVTSVEDAGPPRRESDKRSRLAGAAGLGALGFVLAAVTWLEYRARRIASVDEVVHGLGLRVVGALPEISDRARRRARSRGAVGDVQSRMLVESVDATRTMLLRASATEALRVVMVTSALGGEGKTSLSCHLATSLARAGRRTLLLDGDLRSPAIHRLFDLPGTPGLCELLRNEAELDEIVRPTAADGLWVIPAGSCDASAVQALAQGRLGAFFREVRLRYDFVVVDTSPVLPVADALLIGEHVDAAICSILREVSRLPKVYAANERLLTLGIRILGAVVSGTRGELDGSEYYYSGYARA